MSKESECTTIDKVKQKTTSISVGMGNKTAINVIDVQGEEWKYIIVE